MATCKVLAAVVVRKAKKKSRRQPDAVQQKKRGKVVGPTSGEGPRVHVAQDVFVSQFSMLKPITFPQATQ